MGYSETKIYADTCCLAHTNTHQGQLQEPLTDTGIGQAGRADKRGNKCFST